MQNKKVPGSNVGRGLSVWILHVLPVLVWVSSGYSGFLPQSKDMHVSLIGGSKLATGVIMSMHGCSSTCGPARWTGALSRVYHCLPPEESWDRLQQSSVTLNRTMDNGWVDNMQNLSQKGTSKQFTPPNVSQPA